MMIANGLHYVRTVCTLKAYRKIPDAIACCAWCGANVPSDYYCKRCKAFICTDCDDRMIDLCETCRTEGGA